MTDEKQPSSGSRQRIDKWLFFARMVKSRSLAQVYIQKGSVRVKMASGSASRASRRRRVSDGAFRWSGATSS